MASSPWEQPDQYVRVLDSLARFYNSEKTVHAGYLITSIIAVMALLSAVLNIVLSPTLEGVAFGYRMAAMLIIAAATLICYFGINKPLPFLFRYLLGRMQLYLWLSEIVWEHMGLKASGDFAEKLRHRTENPDLNGVQDAVMTFLAARLYISICNMGQRYLEIDSVEKDFAASGLLKHLWAYRSKFLCWKLTDLVILAHRQNLQGYENGGELHKRIFRRFSDLGIVEKTRFVAQPVIANLAEKEINATGARTMILIGGGPIDDPVIDVRPLAEHGDYVDFLKKAASHGWRIVPLQGQKTLFDFYNEISSSAQRIQDKQKPILIGHSAGALVALNYLKDRRLESWFEKTILFNCPLIYPRAERPALKSSYLGTERVTADAQLIMSEYDDVLMPLSLDSIDMRKAIEIVRQAGKVQVQVVCDKPKYDHSPFSPIDVAWDIVSKLPVLTITPKRQRIHCLKSTFGALARKLQ
jgi:hypothetical protein